MKSFKRGWVSQNKDSGEWTVVIEEVVRDKYRSDSKEEALRLLAAEKEIKDLRLRGEFFAYDRFPIKDDDAELLEVRYRVTGNGEEYETREEAEQYALEQAKEIAERDDIDPDEITIYGGPTEPEGWGACPRDGERWENYPTISIMLR